MTYLVQHTRPMPSGPERYDQFPDAAQAAWRLATRCGAAVVVDESHPTVPVGKTRRWENRKFPYEPVVIFDDLRPDASIRARRGLLRFLERHGRYPYPAVTRLPQDRQDTAERVAAPIRGAWAQP